MNACANCRALLAADGAAHPGLRMIGVAFSPAATGGDDFCTTEYRCTICRSVMICRAPRGDLLSSSWTLANPPRDWERKPEPGSGTNTPMGAD